MAPCKTFAARLPIFARSSVMQKVLSQHQPPMTLAMFRTFLDHIAIVSPTLEAGCAYVRAALGVEPQAGGEHDRMGTHNRLLRLGETLYLEVIAPNPVVRRPPRPRWFELDTLAPDAPPRLGAWVARTSDIHCTLAASEESLGRIEPMSRGSLEWLITIPADGSLPMGGAAPALIEWHTDTHPALRLDDMGLTLERLEIRHPDPERVERLLRALKITGPVAVVKEATTSPHLVAQIRTPQGLRTL